MGTTIWSIDGPVVQLLCSSVSEEEGEGRGLGVASGSEGKEARKEFRRETRRRGWFGGVCFTGGGGIEWGWRHQMIEGNSGVGVFDCGGSRRQGEADELLQLTVVALFAGELWWAVVVCIGDGWQSTFGFLACSSDSRWGSGSSGRWEVLVVYGGARWPEGSLRWAVEWCSFFLLFFQHYNGRDEGSVF
ncbi:unnamed protein product [Lactuca saligna]|uniref:Uncharacterized protein n=1 Tax=Lactuca saligna TaxID=75948 RepID=A0AA35ZV01_LACSI|nr:unnamed protein product [Lactuca saligna]